MAKLMLVEDDNNLREIYEARLQAEGYQITPARDGEEALVLAKKDKPDLIIADVMMPKISGFEMLDILRNTDGLKDVKVIMLTALGQSDDQQRATRLGADRYLVKSQVTLEDIVKVSHELLGDQQSADAAPEPAAPAAPATSTPPAAQAPAPTVTPGATPVAVAPAPTPAPPVAAEPATPAPAPVAASPNANAATTVPDQAPTPTVTPAATPVTVASAPTSAPPAAVEPPQPSVSPVAAPEPAALPSAPPVPPETETPYQATPPATAAPAQPEPDNAQKADEPTAADATAKNDAEPAAQEKADLEGKVEDFVAGATEEPTPPAGASPAEAPTDAAPAPDAPVDPAIKENDAKLVEDAAETLANSANNVEEGKGSSSPGAIIEPTGPPPTAGEPAPPTKQTSEVEESKPPADGRSKKIIKPLDNKPKRDINTLLALEEAKEAGSKAPPPPTPVIVADNPKAPTAPAPPNPVVEPPAGSETQDSPLLPPVSAPEAPAQPAGAAAPASSETSAIEPNNPADPNSIAL